MEIIIAVGALSGYVFLRKTQKTKSKLPARLLLRWRMAASLGKLSAQDGRRKQNTLVTAGAQRQVRDARYAQDGAVSGWPRAAGGRPSGGRVWQGPVSGGPVA